ncbi:hypothetical protein F5Y16DRAFT_391754 [Xylariaceae sp. FL0255]|nr:hypothetical protein F5Y16DRAFT_391754 [Xylariaceae sp. FL0255]
MKRKATAQGIDLSAQERAPRQIPVSCENCRKKKLKCDRGAPCSSCSIRGIACTGQPGPGSSDTQLLSRLKNLETAVSRLDSLEKAVFGGARLQAACSSTPATAATTPSQSTEDTERERTAKFLDSTYTRDDHSIAHRLERLRFQVSAASSPSSLRATGLNGNGEEIIRSACLMTRDEALSLLNDFVENPYHMLPIIYKPFMCDRINKLYDQLEQSGSSGDPALAALILSIASTSASFFALNDASHNIFTSIEEANLASITWRQTALTILGDAHSNHGSLEECQAWTILAYVVYNTEGCSAQFRFLHSCSIAVARDISLHLTDSLTSGKEVEDVPTKEIKRRLWWHLASTDWLLGLVGGPLDGTYSIQLRHFNVRRPRNLNDNDLTQEDDTLTYPLNVPTQLSCFIQRIRLSEIIRASIDAREIVDTEITDIAIVARLDRLFEQALSELPPFMQIGAKIPAGAPLHLAQQRDLILLCFHIRRARLHRPFLLHNTDEPRYEPSRRQCIVSARTVLFISTAMLEGKSASDQSQRFRHPSAYRAGLLISGIFLACTILALHASLTDTGNHRSNDNENSEIVTEITRACRALAKAGEESVFATNLVRNLMDVLKRYRVKEISDLVDTNLPHSDSQNNSTEHDANSHDHALTRNNPISNGEMINFAGNVDLWNDFLTTMPEADGYYDQLFAGLDSFFGPT